MGQIIIDLPTRIKRRYRLNNKDLANAIVASLEAEASIVPDASKLTKEDISDIRAARAAKEEYTATGESFSVDELRAEFNL
ncbi:MAG TPA: hypothetical protein VNI84_11445 [Pyrinomonadaceae bacterium]|nr:hypothetical protein [Pyrinomonadaceae bacterium]